MDPIPGFAQLLKALATPGETLSMVGKQFLALSNTDKQDLIDNAREQGIIPAN